MRWHTTPYRSWRLGNGHFHDRSAAFRTWGIEVACAAIRIDVANDANRANENNAVVCLACSCDARQWFRGLGNLRNKSGNFLPCTDNDCAQIVFQTPSRLRVHWPRFLRGTCRGFYIRSLAPQSNHSKSTSDSTNAAAASSDTRFGERCMFHRMDRSENVVANTLQTCATISIHGGAWKYRKIWLKTRYVVMGKENVPRRRGANSKCISN